MRLTAKKTFFLSALMTLGLAAVADEASGPYQNTQVQAHLRVDVKQGVETVHFIRDNADGDVVTKAYVLKHADPYEIRKHLRLIVDARRIDDAETGITAVKFNDGTGVLLISAEEYSFEDSTNDTMGFDSLIEQLDQPNITASSGQPIYVYYPKFRSAEELMQMVQNAGANMADDTTEAIGGGDMVNYDSGLNLLFMQTALFSRKNIEKVLSDYDIEYPEVRARVTIYELYAENDAKIGTDFQAWKNNEGVNFFSAGGRWRDNWSLDGSTMANGMNWSDTKYVNFNPQWNSRYLDFLTAKGKAQVVHRGEIAVRNNETGTIERTTQVFFPEATPIDPTTLEGNNGVEIDKQHGNAINTRPSDAFGFTMTVTPSIGSKATTVAVQASNSSLIGYKSDGSPRIQQGNAIKTNVMIGNNGTKLVLGGLEKRDVVKGSSGVPFLKDIPILGYFFSTEGESTKRSQLVVVAEIIQSKLDSGLDEEQKAMINDLEEELASAGESNSFGYRQYGIDSER